MSSFPVFDLGSFETASVRERSRLGQTVDGICRDTGFLAIKNHGVDRDVIDSAWNGAKAFFDLPMAEKEHAATPYAGYPYGYIGPALEALARSTGADAPPDLKETFNSGPDAVALDVKDADAMEFAYAPSIWPENPAGFRAAWSAYYDAMNDLSARLMRVFAVALELDEDYFAPLIDKPASGLRALNYYDLDEPPKPGQIRAGAHTDYGSLTILLQRDSVGGLEIFNPRKEWEPVPVLDDVFVINIGDLMARWTNGRWVSTLHRVVNPPKDSNVPMRRQSIAHFHLPNWDAVIEAPATCANFNDGPPPEPVVAGPYLAAKFKATTEDLT